MTLNKEDIMKFQKSNSYRTFYIKTLKGELLFKKLKYKDVVELQGKDDSDSALYLLSKSIINDDGKEMFTPNELKEFHQGIINELSDIVARYNNIGVTVGDIEKN